MYSNPGTLFSIQPTCHFLHCMEFGTIYARAFAYGYRFTWMPAIGIFGGGWLRPGELRSASRQGSKAPASLAPSPYHTPIIYCSIRHSGKLNKV